MAIFYGWRMTAAACGIQFLLAALLMCSASLAFAHCPNVPVCEMKAIDTLLPETKLAIEVRGPSAKKVPSMSATPPKLHIKRLGDDLVIEGEGERLVKVSDFFTLEPTPREQQDHPKGGQGGEHITDHVEHGGAVRIRC